MYKTPVELIDQFGNDRMVVNVARVSFAKWLPKDLLLDDRDEKLVYYLARHGHKSPFYHPKVQVRINVPVCIGAQAKRHQVGFDLNEVSRRYVDDEPEFYLPDQWRGRPLKSIKQGSGTAVIEKIVIDGVSVPINEAYKTFIKSAVVLYDSMIESGVAPEMARMVLPQSMYTSWIWTGSLYGLANFCWQRNDSHAQLESQWLAQGIDKIVGELFPISWKALMKHKARFEAESDNPE